MLGISRSWLSIRLREQYLFFCDRVKINRTAILFVIVFAFSSPANSREELINFSIEEQLVTDALLAFARQADVSLLMPVGFLKQVESNAIIGRYQLQIGLELMLRGTGVDASIVEGKQIIIHDPDGGDSIQEENEMRNLNRNLYAIAAAAAMVGVGDTEPAQAQDQRQSMREIQEVVVTARRREESLQDIPLAVTTMSTEQLEDRGVQSMENLNTLVPNVMIEGSFLGGGAGDARNLRVRGLPGVEVYVDGVPGGGGLFDSIDLERVEILKGPQGTLFGRNAMAGAIQYITASPEDSFGGSVKATMGTNNWVDFTGTVNIPLSDTFLTKVTAAQQTRDGYVDSTTLANYSYGSIDNQNLRLQGLWTPTSDFSGRFIFDYTDNYSNGSATVLTDYSNCLDGSRGADASCAPALTTVGTFAVLGEPITASELGGEREEWTSSQNWTGPGAGLERYKYTLDLNWDISDSWALRSLSSYREEESFSYTDSDSTYRDIFHVWLWDDVESTSQEFQLLYDSGDRLSGVAGLFYLNTKGLDNKSRYHDADLQPLGRLYDDWVTYCGANPCLIPPPAPGMGYGASVNDPAITDETQKAFFTEWNFDITERLSLTAGVRYTEVSAKTWSYLSGHPNFVGMNGTNSIWNAEGRPCCEPIFEFQAGPLEDFTNVNSYGATPRLSLQYDVAEDSMVYVSYSEGFSEGGINTLAPPGTAFSTYDPETLENYEIGLRSDLLNNRLRLNATAFFTEWQDIQVAQELNVGGTSVILTTNVGEAEASGVEIEGLYFVSDNFTVDYAYGYLKTEYTDNGGKITNPMVGSSFAYSPENSYSFGGNYTTYLDSGAELMFRLDYGWKDDYIFNRNNAPLVDIMTYQQAYGVLGGRITYTAPGEQWDISLHGSNLTDEFYSIGGSVIPFYGFNTGSPGRGREIALSLNARF
ncbi:MAG: hypothetical protein CMQ38_11975 [Gammaproteobacteria bacterium]|nr:hypothetical protein [Gammaproteobacteria bacterium]